jgi:hypothetical protein
VVSLDPFFAGNPASAEKLLLNAIYYNIFCGLVKLPAAHTLLDAKNDDSCRIKAAETGLPSVSTQYSTTPDQEKELLGSN